MLTFCERFVGSCSVEADLSWPGGDSVVLQILGRDGRRWVAKQSREHAVFRREWKAYSTWVSAIQDAAPRLVAADPVLQVILVTWEEGDIHHNVDLAIHRQAGALCRRFHGAAPPLTADTGFARRIAARVTDCFRRHVEIFQPYEIAAATESVRLLQSSPPPPVVPAHMDYQPRNWLVTRDGQLRVIDFGRSRNEAWLYDFVRLENGPWRSDPQAKKEFFDGYGRTLNSHEQQLLGAFGVVAAITTIVWAHARGNQSLELQGRRILESSASHA